MTLESFHVGNDIFIFLPSDFSETLIYQVDCLKSVHDRQWQTDGLSNHLQSIFFEVPALFQMLSSGASPDAPVQAGLSGYHIWTSNVTIGPGIENVSILSISQNAAIEHHKH